LPLLDNPVQPNGVPLSQYTIAVGSITVTASGVVYVGTGEPNGCGDCFYGAGILKSEDGGRTWVQLGLGTFWQQSIFNVIVSPSDPNKILAAVTSGLWSSTDGGTTWSDIGTSFPSISPGASFTSLALDPTNSSIVYAAGGGEIFKSADFGVTWTLSTPSSTGGCFAKAGRCPRISLAIAASSPSTVLAAADDGTLWRTTDSGATWSLVNSPHAPFGVPFSVTNFCNEADGSQCDYDILVAVDPTDPNIIFLGGQDLWVTFNGGRSWGDIGGYDGNSVVDGNIHSDQHAVAFSPADHQKIFVGNDGGIWTTRWHPVAIGGIEGHIFKWVDRNNGLSITQFYSVAADPQELSGYFGGTQDIGIVDHDRRSSLSHVLSSTAWDDSNPGDAGWTGYDPSDPTTQYAGFSGFSGGACAGALAAGSCFLRRDNGSHCCFELNSWFGVFQASGGGIPTVAAIDPSTPSTLYYVDPVSGSLFKSTDRGGHWASTGLDLTTACGGKSCGGSISAVAVAPSNGAFVYAGTTNGKFFASTDGGATFQERDSVNARSSLPDEQVTKIAVEPADPSVAFATFGGFGAAQHVWMSHQAGANWTDISSGLPAVPADSILVDAAGTGAIYVGTDSGVFVSLDSGSTWQAFGTGLPRVQVTDLEFSAGHVALVAATHGRGIWTISHLPMHAPTYVATYTQGLGANAQSVEADCYPGDFATGGGFEITDGAKAPLASEPNVTSGEPTGWVARFGVGTGGMAKVFADCMAPRSVAGTVTSTNAVEADRTIPCTRVAGVCVGSPAGGVTASCAGNEVATGGGFATGGSKVVRQSRPDVASGTPTGWLSFFGLSLDTRSVTVKSFAICSPGPGFSTGVVSAASSFGFGAGGRSVACPAGHVAVGGGFSFTGGTNVPLRSEPNVPSGIASSWFTFFGVGTGGTATALVVCMTGGTSLSVSCSPSSVLVGAQTACTATVSNLDPTSSLAPSGPVTFSGSRPGTFSPAHSCDLSGTGASSACSVQFAPSAGSVGLVSITATYNGDADHLGSSGSSSLKVFDFTLEAAPSDRTVLRGGSAPYTVTTALVAGSLGAPASVGLVVSGLPADASAGPATLDLPGSGTLRIRTGAVSLGDFALTISGTVQGGSRSAAVGLHIYDFTVTATPSSLQILTTGSNAYSASVLLMPGSTTMGLPPIALATGGLPAGATGSFSPASGTPSFTSTLTITTNSTPSGAYTLTIAGTDGGIPEGGTRGTHPKLVVLTPAQALQLVINQVNNLHSAGVLNHGQAHSLIVKLRHAIDNLNHRPGKPTACNQMSAFVHEVKAYVAAGILTPAQAGTLLGGPLGVLAIMAAIPC
jgi:hypothetical protein